MPSIRNIGIIAHVDHGKTTLVDELLKQAGTFRDNQAVADRVMDSMDLEREKGITIRAKNTAVEWKEHTINIVDTPGHADFGGEVERILKMVDGVFLLVDAVDGPQAQTRFVLRKAIEQDLRLVVFVNKIDREFADPHRVHEEVMELLLELHASEEQFDAPFLYGSARDGYALRDPADAPGDMTPLFETVLASIPPPAIDAAGPFEMLVSNLDWSDYVGRIGIGKITGGRVAVGDPIFRITHEGKRVRARVTRLYHFAGLGTVECEAAEAGEIVGLAGPEDLDIGETLCALDTQEALPFVAIDPPTITMQFAVNDGPFAGKDGQYVTARNLSARLLRESRTSVSFNLENEQGNHFTISARGELQIAVVVETMRREGYEVLLSRPEVITKEIDGKRLEPYEDLWLEIPADTVGPVMERLAARRMQITDMQGTGSTQIIRGIGPTRGFIGLESALINLTRGEAVVSHSFREYGPPAGEIVTRGGGSLVSTAEGVATAYALDGMQQRGKLFIGPGEEVYVGMVLGDCAKAGDLPVNPTRAKQLTNVRASGSDRAIQLEPPEQLTLEKAIEFIGPDEYVEATPNFLRIRKRILDPHARKKAARS